MGDFIYNIMLNVTVFQIKVAADINDAEESFNETGCIIYDLVKF